MNSTLQVPLSLVGARGSAAASSSRKHTRSLTRTSWSSGLSVVLMVSTWWLAHEGSVGLRLLAERTDLTGELCAAKGTGCLVVRRIPDLNPKANDGQESLFTAVASMRWLSR